jgi:chromosome segregation ATPase
MVNGADAILGIYSAMNDRPECYLSKEDFQAKEDKLDTQKKDLEEKIKDAMKEAEDAQTEFADQLAKWAETEGELADKLAAIPGESEDAKYKLSSEKVKIKMQVDSKYNGTIGKMGELRRKYNDMVSAKSVALAENSQFAIHDRCTIIATGGDPTKQSAANPKPPQAVQASFAGAFAQGRALSANIQKRYDNCLNVEAKKLSRLESSFTSELAAIKADLQAAEASLGQLAEEKRMADEEIIREIGKIDIKASATVKEIQGKYQRIQTEKTNKQAALKSKLERLASETKKNQQQLAILQMKLSHYAGKSPPKNMDGKSMGDMLNQCGENYRVLLESFQTTCCKADYNYNGTGSSACRYKATDYTKPVEKKDPKETKASKKSGK